MAPTTDRAIRDLLAELAPNVDHADVDPDAPLQTEFGLDSMSFLRLVTAVEERLGVAVPESAYPAVSTLNGLVDYVSSALGG